MDKKICPECNTENEEQYSYCKNCGASLTEQKEDKTYSQDNSYDNQSADFYSSDSYIDGIPEIEYQLYIGKNYHKFIPKFRKMEFTRSKYSWSWAPAILGFLGGPLWAALWFFYRKIYKPAWLLVAIGTVIGFTTSLLTMNVTGDYLESILNALSSGNIDLFLHTVANSPETITLLIANTITDISSIATALFAGLFANNLYKNHIKNKITEYKIMQSNPQHYRLGLTYIGGTSGGMLAVGLVLMFGIDKVVSFITKILASIF